MRFSAGGACCRQSVTDGSRAKSGQYGYDERGYQVLEQNIRPTVSLAHQEREKMYARGGIFSITSRILVVDFLSSTGSETE